MPEITAITEHAAVNMTSHQLQADKLIGEQLPVIALRQTVFSYRRCQLLLSGSHSHAQPGPAPIRATRARSQEQQNKSDTDEAASYSSPPDQLDSALPSDRGPAGPDEVIRPATGPAQAADVTGTHTPENPRA